MTVAQLIEEARDLSEEDRKKLSEALQETFEVEPGPGGGLEYFVSLAGTADAEETDISSNKYKYLFEDRS